MRRSTVALAIGAVLTLDAAVLIQTHNGGPLSFANNSHAPHPVHRLPNLGLPTIPGVPPLPLVNGDGGLLGGNGGGSGNGGGNGGGTSPTPAPSSSNPGGGSGGGGTPAPPPGPTSSGALTLAQKGVLIGAYPRVQGSNANGEAQTVEFEKQQGRRLDVDSHYTSFTEPMPAIFQWDVQQGRLPMMSMSGRDTNEIAAGKWDAAIKQRADAVKKLGKPILIRLMYEMEGNPHAEAKFVRSSSSYIQAWRRVVTEFRQDGASNAQFVWCPTANGFRPNGGRASQFYPGDQYVDVVASDGYNWAPGRGSWRSFKEVFANFYDWAMKNTPNKPLLIGETGVQEWQPGQKAQWLQGMAETLRDDYTHIKAVVYFNSAPKYPWWIDSSQSSLNAWRSVVNNEYFDTRNAAKV